MAFSVHIPPNVNVIPISPTSSWPCLYTRDFYGLFCIFTSPLVSLCLHISCLHMHVPLVTYCVHMPSLAHIFCMFLMPNSVHIPTHVDEFSMSITTSDLICTRVTFIAYFVYLVLIGELIFTWYIFNGYMCTHNWWTILYIYLLLLTYSVRYILFVTLVCKTTSPCWSIFWNYHLFKTKFVQ